MSVESDYVVVARVQGQFDEEQVRAFLAVNGISTYVRGETVRTAFGISIDGLGLVEILVAPDVADLARDLLTRADRGEFTLVEADQPDGAGG